MHVTERLASGSGMDKACVLSGQCELEDLVGPRSSSEIEKQRQW